MVTYHSEGRLGDRVVIVTGGSRGTGLEVAHAFGRSGYAVVIGYAHSQGAADVAVDEILSAGGAAIAIRADVGDELDVERLFLETREQFGGVDLVVEAPGRMSVLVRGAAGRHLRPGGTLVSFAGAGLTGTPVDIGRVIAWLTAHPSAEVVVLPVSDAERAMRFYGDLGWRLDDDLAVGESFRLVRMTPPGSTASVIFGVGVTPAAPGTAAGLLWPAPDIVPLDDPDGNTWLPGATRTRLPGR